MPIRHLLALGLALVFAPSLPACGGGAGTSNDVTSGSAADTGGPMLPGPDTVTAEADLTTAPDNGCAPTCGERGCGPDGCGGRCGECQDDETCDASGQCQPCVPDCGLRWCGWDGCGGSCGECEDNEVCTGLGRCQCVPDCAQRTCGPDGCGGSCGACDVGWHCGDDARCHELCYPDCSGGCCGDDGCGGSCDAACTDVELSCEPEGCFCAAAGGTVCGGALPALSPCDTLLPAPTTAGGRHDYLRAAAVPLRCDALGAGERDLVAFGADFRGHAVFLFGEVHGSDELGRLSADLFEHLVRTGAVNTLAMEIGSDVSPWLNEYVETGGGPAVYQLGIDSLAEGLFLRTLVQRARALYEEGYPVRAWGIDTPLRGTWLIGELRQVVAAFPKTGAQLEPFPSTGMYGSVPLSEAEGYRDRVIAEMDTICEELADEAECERVRFLVEAIWLNAFSMSGAIASGSPTPQTYEFFRIREDLIYYNYRRLITDENVRVYAHMGAAHTAKESSVFSGGYESTGTRLDKRYALTASRVYSTAPAYGAGSRILYGYDIYPLSAEPAMLAGALSDAPSDEYYVSTWRPDQSCTVNPLAGVNASDTGVLYSEGYDALTWFRQLTPDNGAKRGRSGLPPLAALFLERRDAVAAAYRKFLRATAP